MISHRNCGLTRGRFIENLESDLGCLQHTDMGLSENRVYSQL